MSLELATRTSTSEHRSRGASYEDELTQNDRNRSGFIIGYMSLAAVGYLILAIAESTKVRFGGVFVVGLSLYGAVGLNVTWVTTNTAGHFRRATSVGKHSTSRFRFGAEIVR